jgi:hypothetical protein
MPTPLRQPRRLCLHQQRYRQMWQCIASSDPNASTHFESYAISSTCSNSGLVATYTWQCCESIRYVRLTTSYVMRSPMVPDTVQTSCAQAFSITAAQVATAAWMRCSAVTSRVCCRAGDVIHLDCQLRATPRAQNISSIMVRACWVPPRQIPTLNQQDLLFPLLLDCTHAAPRCHCFACNFATQMPHTCPVSCAITKPHAKVSITSLL